jgi:hypothetical protein
MNQMAELAKQRKKRGLKFQLIGGDTFTNLILDKKDVRLFDGVQFSFPPDPSHDRRNNLRSTATLQSKFGRWQYARLAP